MAVIRGIVDVPLIERWDNRYISLGVGSVFVVFVQSVGFSRLDMFF